MVLVSTELERTFYWKVTFGLLIANEDNEDLNSCCTLGFHGSRACIGLAHRTREILSFQTSAVVEISNGTQRVSALWVHLEAYTRLIEE